MLIADYDYDTDIRVKKQEAYEEGVSAGITQGIAKQKAEDEKILQAQIDENKRLLEEIEKLKAAQMKEKAHC